ncbi:MAG: PQQ-binding-like beta-propeller repeat protein [Planctomycetaceae bacterium]|nr:PQQ-binding-like beta-propeller repeat protein [Planctomycetaceae bacterium]MBT6485729.1 PQQ-binding-like beta-propeller repeat protein [Planctomycetaceae bacterium]MBT6497060.1 PQQ-binding-like beta-propeller repeat protein [Planctomycetaceae bacterium]
MSRWTANCVRFLVMGTIGALLLAAPGVHGQIQLKIDPNGKLIPAEEGTDPTLQPQADIDKNLSKALKRAEELRDQGDYDNALEILQRKILSRREDRNGKPSADSSADYFADQTMTTSLKDQALKLIAGLPSEGRRLYELKFGDAARTMFEEAVVSNDRAQLENITRQYFHTKAGYEATYLIGTHRLDQGEPLAAAMQFSQLQELPEAGRRWQPMLSLKLAIAWYQAGETDRALSTLIALKKATPNGRLSLGQRTISLFANDKEAEGWLTRLVGPPIGANQGGQRQWVMFRGDASRNTGSSPASPAWDSVWEFATVRDPDTLDEDPARLDEVNTQLRQMETEKGGSGFLTLPAAHPLIVNDVVVFRTLRNLRAVHLKTGQLLWESTMVSEAYEKLVSTTKPAAAVRVNQQPSALASFLAQRAWRDLAAGTLSSDGRYVFALEEMDNPAPPPAQRVFRGAPPQTTTSRNSSKLGAYDLAAGGKSMWEVGGPREYGFEMAGTYFLGPPLPLDGKLYCIAEVTGDVRLMVLNAETGALQWSQSLALPDAAFSDFPLRRLAGLTPAFSNGVLVCPTTAGAVVAIDPARRILLWGQRYSRSKSAVPIDPRIAFRMRGRRITVTSGQDDEDRWVDSAPTIAEGRILITPRDSADLHCLNLVDGSLLWKKPRGQSLYLAGVHAGQVILVGRSQVQALSLKTGEPVWDEPPSIETPSGRGIRDGHHYRLPLSTGEIVSIDLKSGRIVARSQSRKGEVFGNLAAADGVIVSQSIDKLVGFKSLDELRRQTDGVLAKNPNDADALALRGEMRLHEGNERQGLADLRKSIAAKPTPRSRTLVVASLLEGLRLDFRKYHSSADEIERLVDDPRQRGQYLRLNAAGLHEMGDQQGAFREYIKLATADTGKPELERVSAALTVRSDRWIRPRIAEVYRKSSGAERAELDRAIAELLTKAAENEDDTQMLIRFLDAFVDLPVGDRAGQLLAGRLDPIKQTLAQELLLRRLRRSTDRKISGFATARLASLYIDRKQSVAAAAMLDELATRWNDVVCLDEKTGRQLVEEWRAADEIAKLLEEKSVWPKEKLEARKVARQGSVRRAYPVRIIGPRGPLGENWTLALDSRRQSLIAHDENGKVLWKVATGNLRTAISNVYGNYARVNGHLLIVVFGSHFIVLDGFQEENGAPRILWQQVLVDGLKGQTRNIALQFRQLMGPGGARIMTVLDRNGRPLGQVVPIDDSMICYQVGTRLVAANPLTGETLWERRSVSRGSDVFGDREFVFVVAPNTKEAVVLRAADGEQVATRPLPQDGTQLSKQGRNLLVWTGRTLQKFDVWTGKNIWEKRVPPGSKAIAMQRGENAVAVLNPHQGNFAIFDADDGKLLIDASIEADGRIDSFLVLRNRDRYTLLTHSTPKQANGVQVVSINNSPLVNGYVYGFDRKTGRKIWTTRVENQSFDVNQPAGLPVLVFTARTYRPFQRAPAFNRNQYSLAVIDKRNGRSIFSEANEQSLSQFEVTADPAEKKMTVNFYRSSLHLNMINEPIASPVKAKRPVEGSGGE